MRKKYAFITTMCVIAVVAFAQRQTTFLRDWKFNFGNVSNAQALDFDASKWADVRVPHDWAIDKPFDMKIDMQYVQVIADGDKTAKLRTGRTGALPCFGTGWYRTNLDISESDSNKRIFVEFDGAMSRANVFVNGNYVGWRPYGYSSFCFEITKFVNFGGKNVVAVRLENPEQSSRWYPGAGLYRNVRLVKKSQSCIDYNGVYITTPEVSAKKALVEVKTEISNAKGCFVEHKVFDKTGALVAKAKVSDKENSTKLLVENPKLWDIENPELYVLQTSLVDANGKVLDNVKTRFGIRSIDVSLKNGFQLNGKRVEIQGVCMHHDLGPIGAATNVSALRRQLRILKEMGCNAIRTSHNPPSPELLDLCDEMGFVVQAEAFDEWRKPKNKNGYSLFFDEWAERDLTDFIKRDRNHPSVVMWSIGNEVVDSRFREGAKTARFLTDIAHRVDPTRKVSVGIDQCKLVFKDFGGDFARQVDIVGINYNAHMYEYIDKHYPDLVIHGSETASTVSSRGVYHFPMKETRRPYHDDYHTTSYDVEAPSWATTPDRAFELLDKYRNYFGEFVWTGFDYLGEPTPYNPGTPARSSYFGIVDLAGLKKDRFYLYQSRWNKNTEVLHILPHWNWDDREGKNVPVMCYTNFPEVELFVNGESQGKRKINKDSKRNLDHYRLIWDNVVYKAGELKAVAYDSNGKQVAEKIVKTTDKPSTLKITAEANQKLVADKDELVFVEISVEDKNGNVCPRANSMVFVKVEGAGKLRALCNGDPTDQVPFSAGYMRAFSGKLIAVIEPTGEKGEVSISAGSMMLKAGLLKLQLK